MPPCSTACAPWWWISIPQANATIALDTGPTTATVADVLDEPRRSVLHGAIAPSGWGEGLDVLVGAEQTERHNHPDPGPKQLDRLRRALHRLVDAEGPLGDSLAGGSDTSRTAW